MSLSKIHCICIVAGAKITRIAMSDIARVGRSPTAVQVGAPALLHTATQ